MFGNISPAQYSGDSNDKCAAPSLTYISLSRTSSGRSRMRPFPDAPLQSGDETVRGATYVGLVPAMPQSLSD